MKMNKLGIILKIREEKIVLCREKLLWFVIKTCMEDRHDMQMQSWKWRGGQALLEAQILCFNINILFLFSYVLSYLF